MRFGGDGSRQQRSSRERGLGLPQQPLREPVAHGLALNRDSVPEVAEEVVMNVARSDKSTVRLKGSDVRSAAGAAWAVWERDKGA